MQRRPLQHQMFGSQCPGCFAAGERPERPAAYPSRQWRKGWMPAAGSGAVMSKTGSLCRTAWRRRFAKPLRKPPARSADSPVGGPAGTGGRRPWTRRPPSLQIVNERLDSPEPKAPGNPLQQTFYGPACHSVALAAARQPCLSRLKVLRRNGTLSTAIQGYPRRCNLVLPWIRLNRRG